MVYQPIMPNKSINIPEFLITKENLEELELIDTSNMSQDGAMLLYLFKHGIKQEIDKRK